MLLASYFLLAFREFLSNAYQEQWIGRGGATAWAARSLHLNPLDFHIWGHPNSTVRAVEVGSDGHQFQQRVQRVFELIPTPGLCQRIRQ